MSVKYRFVPIAHHISQKRDELIFALSLQGYKNADIGRIFNVDRSVIGRILKLKPANWQPKWVKMQD